MEHYYLTEEIKELEAEIQEKKKRLAELIRQAPAEKVNDYTFEGPDGNIRLSEMFGDKDELLLIHNMGKKCPYCTLWADGFNGIRHHLENRAAFVVVSPDPPEIQREFAEGRGWKFRMFSCADNSFAEDLKFKGTDGYYPGFSTFRKDRDGSIYRTGFRYFGPGDDFCSAWHLFDILPGGIHGWAPKFSY
jgi:predicted dithiol-disulfide oxidoreductase (DUF899 family)